MARYRKIDIRIWNDERFGRLSDDAKLVFLFLLTHPYMTSLGAMRATLPGLAAELGWIMERFQEAFNELVTTRSADQGSPDDHALVEFDDRACFIGLPNFLKYNGPENPNVVTSWAKSIDLLPECSLKTKVLKRANACMTGRSEKFVEAWEGVLESLPETLPKGFGDPLPKGMPNQEQEPEPQPEPEREQKPEPRKRSAAVAAASVAGTDQVVDRELLDWLRWWNSLKANSLVRTGVNEREPSRAIVQAWKRCKADASLCERLRDRGAIEREIRASSFLRSAGWFRLEKLLGGRTRDLECILTKLLESSYQDRKEPYDKAHNSTGSKSESLNAYIARHGDSIERGGSSTPVAEERPIR